MSSTQTSQSDDKATIEWPEQIIQELKDLNKGQRDEQAVKKFYRNLLHFLFPVSKGFIIGEEDDDILFVTLENKKDILFFIHFSFSHNLRSIGSSNLKSEDTYMRNKMEELFYSASRGAGISAMGDCLAIYEIILKDGDYIVSVLTTNNNTDESNAVVDFKTEWVSMTDEIELVTEIITKVVNAVINEVRL